jgi:hypothetical protein
VKVTRIAYSRGVNAGKYGLLVEQARRWGAVVGVGAVRVDHGCGRVRPADPRWVDGGWRRRIVGGVGERVEGDRAGRGG